MPKFEYDDQKSKSNFRKHGLDFEEAQLIWNRRFPLLIEEDERFEYEEKRRRATGPLPNLVCIVVTYTVRNRSIRIISARQAMQVEREYYYEQSGYTPTS